MCGGGVEGVGRQGGEGGVRREGRGVVNSPTSERKCMYEGEVLLAFGCEGLDVARFHGIAQLDKAYGVMALDGGKAGCCEKVGR